MTLGKWDKNCRYPTLICPNCYRGAYISSRRMSLYSDAKKMYSAAIEAVSPSKLIARALQFDPDRGLLSVGGGEYALKR